MYGRHTIAGTGQDTMISYQQHWSECATMVAIGHVGNMYICNLFGCRISNVILSPSVCRQHLRKGVEGWHSCGEHIGVIGCQHSCERGNVTRIVLQAFVYASTWFWHSSSFLEYEALSKDTGRHFFFYMSVICIVTRGSSFFWGQDPRRKNNRRQLWRFQFAWPSLSFTRDTHNCQRSPNCDVLHYSE